jgi:GTP-binding protein HflX
MDLYEDRHFDEWLGDDIKATILQELKERWENDTQGNCVFISAIEKRNIAELRERILEQVRINYKIRYPYKTEFLY